MERLSCFPGAAQQSYMFLDSLLCCFNTVKEEEYPQMHKQCHESSLEGVPGELRNLGRLCGSITFELEGSVEF